jgi:hypothetical protein
MPHPAIVTFTARPIDEILAHGGSRDWRLDAERARLFEYLVCTQNCHNPGFRTPAAAHRAAFLIGRISGVVASPERHDRWLIQISEYIEANIPGIWGKAGPMRYPVWYTTLENLEIDLSLLPPFRSVPPPTGARGMGEAAPALLIAPPPQPLGSIRGRTQPTGRAQVTRPHGGQDPWARLDAILHQIDRIPDLPEPADPLDWDEHGLPR